MFDIIVQNSSNDIFKNFLDLGTALIGYATGFVALYVAHLRFRSKNVKIIDFTPSFKSFYGDEISVTLENCTLSNFSILEIDIIYDNNFLMQLFKFKEPILLESFKAKQLVCQPITSTTPQLIDLDMIKNKFARIITSRGIIYAKISEKIQNKSENITNYQIVPIRRIDVNGTVISNSIKYVLYFKGNNGQIDTIFIDSTGLMDREITDFNLVPQDAMKNKDTLEQFFQNVLQPLEISFCIRERGE